MTNRSPRYALRCTCALQSSSFRSDPETSQRLTIPRHYEANACLTLLMKANIRIGKEKIERVLNLQILHPSCEGHSLKSKFMVRSPHLLRRNTSLHQQSCFLDTSRSYGRILLRLNPFCHRGLMFLGFLEEIHGNRRMI
jgi:hypothetical protein